ncbi:MAG: hypothetical protein Q4D38_12520 [Planctomycetia bacterium]|nr:hypothetical protein [Planctomycetia bacterium]
MIKVVTFMDGNVPEPLAVVAWSIRKNGNLGNAQYILYTTTPELQENPLLQKLYDKIGPPEWDYPKVLKLDWEKRSERFFNRSTNVESMRWSQACWIKFLCFLEEPCSDEDVVIYVDYDTLCIGSLKEAFPPATKAMAGMFHRCGGKNPGRGVSAGLLVKNGLFTRMNMTTKMQEPLWDIDKHREAARLFDSNDEMAIAWYLENYSRENDCFYALPRKYGIIPWEHIRTGKSMEDADARLVHYGGETKPWNGLRAPYRKMQQRWIDARDQMIQEWKEKEGVFR